MLQQPSDCVLLLTAHNLFLNLPRDSTFSNLVSFAAALLAPRWSDYATKGGSIHCSGVYTFYFTWFWDETILEHVGLWYAPPSLPHTLVCDTPSSSYCGFPTPLSHCLCVYKRAVITSISTGMAATRKWPTYLWLDPTPYIHPTSLVMNAPFFGQLFCFHVLLSMQA